VARGPKRLMQKHPPLPLRRYVGRTALAPLFFAPCGRCRKNRAWSPPFSFFFFFFPFPSSPVNTQTTGAFSAFFLDAAGDAPPPSFFFFFPSLSETAPSAPEVLIPPLSLPYGDKTEAGEKPFPPPFFFFFFHNLISSFPAACSRTMGFSSSLSPPGRAGKD